MKKACIVFCDESFSMPNERSCYNRIFLGRQRCRVRGWHGWARLAKGNSLNRRTFALHYARAGPKPMPRQSSGRACLLHGNALRVNSVPLGEWGHGVFDNVCLCQALRCGSKTLGIVKICPWSAPKLMKKCVLWGLKFKIKQSGLKW